MSKTIKLKKGFDINIKGKPQNTIFENFTSKTYSVKPTDFNGIAPIPKVVVNEGDEILAGDVLFFNKKTDAIKYCSPVSGVVKSVTRGAKRSIAEIVIQADKENSYRQLDAAPTNNREALVNWMAANGCWPFLMQRPYGTVADMDATPRSIFISGFDSSPLAVDCNLAVVDQYDNLQAGIDVLNQLASGKVHLGLSAKNQKSNGFGKLTNVDINYFDGPHPAGNVGIQIHHLAPINKGEIVWTVKLQDAITLGRIVKTQQFNTERLFAIGGPQVKNPQHFKAFLGANVEGALMDNLNMDLMRQDGNQNLRIVSGNPLTGKAIAPNGHLGFYDSQISVIEEGDDYEFFGWILPQYQKPSISKTFFWNMFGQSKKAFDVNTNTHGEHRAIVVTGEYEKVLPMDIFPTQLLKSILANDLDLMEGLGIYEVIEEDLALCEYVCTSKTNVQKIIRQGIETMQEQG